MTPASRYTPARRTPRRDIAGRSSAGLAKGLPYRTQGRDSPASCWNAGAYQRWRIGFDGATGFSFRLSPDTARCRRPPCAPTSWNAALDFGWRTAPGISEKAAAPRAARNFPILLSSAVGTRHNKSQHRSQPTEDSVSRQCPMPLRIRTGCGAGSIQLCIATAVHMSVRGPDRTPEAGDRQLPPMRGLREGR